MKEQLESLAQEMVKDIKDLKELTRETLPEVAKEYIDYNMTMATVGFVFFGVVFMLGCFGVIHGLMNDKFYDRNIGPVQVASMFAFLGGAGFSLLNLVSFIQFYLQPRSKAIEGVVKAFKGGQ